MVRKSVAFAGVGFQVMRPTEMPVEEVWKEEMALSVVLKTQKSMRDNLNEKTSRMLVAPEFAKPKQGEGASRRRE